MEIGRGEEERKKGKERKKKKRRNKRIVRPGARLTSPLIIAYETGNSRADRTVLGWQRGWQSGMVERGGRVKNSRDGRMTLTNDCMAEPLPIPLPSPLAAAGYQPPPSAFALSVQPLRPGLHSLTELGPRIREIWPNFCHK